MCKIKKGSYITIQEFMVSELGLKGTKLLIYAIIFGFSQDRDSWFNGSLSYLEEWTNSSRTCVIDTLNELLNLGLIEKQLSTPTNKYRAILGEPKQPEQEHKPEDTTKDTNKYEAEKELQETIDKVITELNTVCGTAFKSTTNATRKIIKSGLKAGFTLEDFMKVIHYKYKEWGVAPVRFSTGQLSSEYLRPSTLFGPHFDEYLQQANKVQETHEVRSTSISKNRSNLVY